MSKTLCSILVIAVEDDFRTRVMESSIFFLLSTDNAESSEYGMSGKIELI